MTAEKATARGTTAQTTVEGLAKLDFALVGVGGQGIVLASDLLAEVGLAAGYDVKKTDSLGMSQRGGSVVSFVRWGPKVYSPLPSRGDVDVVLALEKLEAARAAEWLRPGGIAVVGEQVILPVSVSAGAERYPTDSEVLGLLAARTNRVHVVPAADLAAEIGNPRVVNVVLLGYLSAYLPVELALCEDTLARLIPARIRDVNLTALRRGREVATLASTASRRGTNTQETP
jgi:indolepyruvate ferredoxin oxidoreductase beta subunit